MERAVKAAERRFERHRRIPDWKLHADALELRVDGNKVNSIPKGSDTSVRSLRYIPGVRAT